MYVSEDQIQVIAPSRQSNDFAFLVHFFLFCCCCCLSVLVFFFLLVFQDTVCLCNPGCPGDLSVDQAGLELTEICLPLSLVLGLKVHVTTAWQAVCFCLFI